MIIFTTIVSSLIAGALFVLYFTFTGPITFIFTRNTLHKTINTTLVILLCMFLVFACSQTP